MNGQFELMANLLISTSPNLSLEKRGNLRILAICTHSLSICVLNFLFFERYSCQIQQNCAKQQSVNDRVDDLA